MAKIKEIEISNGHNKLRFICPGCNEEHQITRSWDFDGNFEQPTISPSIKVTFEYSSELNNKKAKEFFLKKGRFPTRKELPYDIKQICHSYIKNGKIEYLGNCHHKLKNQTIDLPQIK